ncbi:hypothetical protein SAMN06265379_10271 [Saccharicrinis carchari]|uniref:Uncharacterized protein n=1 Tax=Saccharicrinis carchari TaxID=1168039 RepID=A0A521BWJ9_SACCC|nr:hypothetical protein [Saccharicrinis carchari]SMO50810.1 hypothetical protein SAMN06265379_10271 [Saccharicrinis carchari]
MKRSIGIIGAVAIVIGFGMIHGSYKNAEIYGGSLIGLGCVILLYLLYTSGKDKNKE